MKSEAPIPGALTAEDLINKYHLNSDESALLMSAIKCQTIIHRARERLRQEGHYLESAIQIQERLQQLENRMAMQGDRLTFAYAAYLTSLAPPSTSP